MLLRYGINPHQSPAYAEPVREGHWPLTVVHGAPSYINLLDALSGWQLVRAAATALGHPAAASFKHVSPAGAAVDGPLDEPMAETMRLSALPEAAGLSPVTRAYVRARDADPVAAYGDFVAVSEPVDATLAEVLRRVVSDGIIAPAYEAGTLDVLRAKKRGEFLVLQADPAFEPPEREVREVFGVRLVQPYNPAPLDLPALAGLPSRTADDLRLGMIAARFTQSNAVTYVRDGMALGIAAGQQARIDSTRIAGKKVDRWFARRGRAATGVAYVSDGMIPFRDNVDEAARHGVSWIAEPGGSMRTGDVRAACTEHGIVQVPTGVRLFHH